MESRRCLNSTIIRDCMGANREQARGTRRFFLICCGLMLLMAGLMLLLWRLTGDDKPLTVLAIMVIVLLFVLWATHGQNRVLKQIARQNYYITEDVCTGKVTEEDTIADTPSTTRYLYLKTYGKLELHFPFVNLTNRSGVKLHDVYEKAEAGDGFYLLRIQSQKKPLCIFRRQDWLLDASEFEETNGCFRPIRSAAKP